MYDASAFSGVWAFRALDERTMEQTISSLRAVGIKGASFTGVEAALTPEPMVVNRRLFAEAAAWRTKSSANDFDVILAPVIDPSLPNWEEELKDCLEEGGAAVRAIKVFPNYHTYPMDATGMDELASALSEKGLPLAVQVRMEDERSRHALMSVVGTPSAEVAAFAARHPALNVLVCASYMLELKPYHDVTNVHIEMSMVESGRLLQAALDHVGADRLLLGTHAPLLYPAVGVSKVTADEAAADVYQRIGSGNFRRLFGL